VPGHEDPAPDSTTDLGNRLAAESNTAPVETPHRGTDGPVHISVFLRQIAEQLDAHYPDRPPLRRLLPDGDET
jgi:hypothetical protein